MFLIYVFFPVGSVEKDLKIKNLSTSLVNNYFRNSNAQVTQTLWFQNSQNTNLLHTQ